jgi:hypothetical protein
MQIKWDIEHVYFYLVSFIALILIIIGAVNLTQTAIAYVTPVYEDYSPYSQPVPSQELNQWEEKYGPEFIAREKERYDAIAKENYRRSLIRDLVRGVSFIIIALPVYLYHWRKIPKLEAAE